MAVDLTQDNSRVVRAAWTAMDQTYRPLSVGNKLLPVDNSGEGRLQPFAVPPGFVVQKVVTGETTGLQVGIYWNETTKEQMVVPMGTNGFGAIDQWRDNAVGSLGKQAWDEVRDKVLPVLDKTFNDAGGGSLIWAGDSRGGAIAQWGMVDFAKRQVAEQGSDGEALPSEFTKSGFHALQNLDIKQNMAGVFHSSPGITWGMSTEDAANAKSLLAGVPCDITADRTGGVQELVSKAGGDYVCGDGTMKFTDAGNSSTDPMSKHRIVDNTWTAIESAGGDFSQRSEGVRETIPLETAMSVGRACAGLLDDTRLATDAEAATRLTMGLVCSAVASPPGTLFTMVQASTQGTLGEFGSTVLAAGAEVGKWLSIGPLTAVTGLTTAVGVPLAKVFENGTPATGQPQPASLDEAVRTTGAPIADGDVIRQFGTDSKGVTHVWDFGLDGVRTYTGDGLSKWSETNFDDGRFEQQLGTLKFIRNPDGSGVITDNGQQVKVIDSQDRVQLEHGGTATPTTFFSVTRQSGTETTTTEIHSTSGSTSSSDSSIPTVQQPSEPTNTPSSNTETTPEESSTAALTPDQIAAADANSASSSATLDSVLPYAAGLNSALSLIQALEQGNTLSAVMAGAGLANTLNHLTDGAVPALPGELSFGLGALSSGLNLLDALDNGDTLGALTAGTNLASQAASLWASSLSNQGAALIAQGSLAEGLAVATEASSAAALSSTLGQIAGAFGVLNSLANGDPLGAVSGLLMMNPATAPIGIALSIGRALFGGLFGDDDGGEPPYIIVKASGDAHFVRHDDGSIGIESSGTNQHKSTEGTAVGAGTQGGQAVASALGALLADLQSQVDAHNAAHPEATFALVPERLPQLHWRDPAYYAEWTDAASGEPRSIAVSGRDLAGDLLAVAQSGAAVVPAWLADTITQRIEAGDTAAWRPAPTPEAAGDTQAQAILVLGSGAMDRTARSDIDADGWSEAHAWSANNLYLTVDSNGDGQIEGLRDLVTLDGEAHAPNRLGWLDADGNGLLDSNDPGFAALKLWLDANGDAVAQDGESAGLQAAGIVAIDFRSYPPALVDAAGNATALTETQLTVDTKGIRTAQTDSGIQVAVEDGETVLLATRTTDYTGDEAHTHREEIAIDAGGARLQSQAAAAPAVVRTETRIEAGDARLKSGAARPVGVAPAATAEQELRSVTAQLISDSQNLFAAAGGLLTVMAFGAGAAQAGTLVEVPPATAPAETTGDVPAYAAPMPPAPAGTMDTGAALYAAPAVTPAATAPTPPWTVTDIAVVVPALPNSLPAAAEYVPPAANVQAAPNALAPAAPESTDGQAAAEPAPANDTTAPAAAGATAPATETDAGATDDAYCLLQPQAGDDVLDDRTEDQAFRIAPAQLLANDTSDAATPLSVVALGAAEHGRVERLADGDIAFFPEADYFGPAAFAYTVGNAFGQTAQGRVAFTIRPVNDAPAVADENAAGTEDTALLVDSAALLANDADVDTVHADLRLTAVSGASHGTVALAADGTVRFTPEADWFGSAGFDYTVADGVGGETVGHVELAIAAVNDAPVATGETVDSAEDEVLLFAPAALLANDADIDTAAADLRIAAVSAASHGTVALDADGSVRFTPDANYFGAAGFDYTVVDGAGGTAQAHVDLALAAVNDAPTVAGEAAAGKANVSMTFTPAALLANDSDIDDAQGALTVAAVGNASHGTVALLPDGRVRFTPETDYTGTGSFSYTVADALGATTAGQVSIDLAHANVAPTAVDDGFTGDEDIPFVIAQSELLANDGDADNAHADLAVTAVGGAQHGTVALQGDGSIRFTPTANYYGSASFTYTVADGDGGQMQAQALLNIRSVNDAPVVETVEYGIADYGFNFQQMWATACIYNDGYYYYPELKSIITPEHSEQTALNVLRYSGYLIDSVGRRVAPDYYLNGHLKPVELDQLDGGAATTYTDYYDGHTTVAAYSDDPYTVPGRIVVYDPDGNSDAFTMSLERAPAHGSVNLGGYAINYSWNNIAGGWKYNSTMGDAYCGADPFQVRITDAGGASTVVTVNTTHYGSSFGGGGGGGGGCPIAIDLDRDGVELVAPDDSQVFADVNGDGWRDRIGWVGNDDGLLALDRDGDGRVGGFDEISFAHDLPGTHTDLEGLRAHDSDGDGFISAGDADWSRFGIWRDADGNGMQEDGEFRSLAEMGVARIGLTGDGKLRTDHGNVVFGETRVELASGESLAAADVMFAGAGVPYPLAVQQALAAAADTSSAAPLLDEAELARRAQAFVQACASAPADDSPPLAFVAAAEAAWLPPVPDWQTPAEQTVGT